MKTTSKNQSNTATADRDSIIGGALSQAIANSPPIDDCHRLNS
ncbi:MAG: hypothetical protein ACOYL3_17150 [Desulfuromonadaceae bacterium]